MKKLLVTTLVLIIAPFLFLQIASAQMLTNTMAENGLDSLTKTVATQANFGNTEIGVIVAQIIKVVLGILAITFLILTVLAGFRWMTAAGNEEEIKKAQGTITAAIIGLIIVLAAYSITYFIFKSVPFGGGGTPQGMTSG